MKKINFEDGVTKGNATTFNQMQTNIENAINGIVESGSNENGSWTKWEDGTMVCRQTIPTGDVALNTTWGSLYVHSNTDNHNFPQPFIEKPELYIETGIVNNSMGYWLGDYGNRHITKEFWRGWCLMRPSSATVNTELFVLAIGKWK